MFHGYALYFCVIAFKYKKMYNTKFIKQELGEITKEAIEKVIKEAAGIGHKSHAPLGCAGDTFILFGESRKKEISLRLHSGDVELLITDNVGNFLFYGRYDLELLPISFISEEYMRVFENTRHLLDNASKSTKITEEDKERMQLVGKIMTYPL